MLSPSEYQDTLWQYNNIPEAITGKQRQSLRQTLRKKLKEHEYASTYSKFEPLPYEMLFVNYRTNEETLIRIIETIKSSSTFILDTESVNSRFQKNKPALIQLQVVLTNSFSYVILVEVQHLPNTHTPIFKYIKQLFEELFHPDKTIYIWGKPEELKDFVKFKLFSCDQIELANHQNLQKEFKRYWIQNHPHNPTLSQCICETCIGIQEKNPWSLQDAIAFALNKWLDKRFTRSSFNIGLDPQLKRLNDREINHRQTIINYAADDCLSMQQLLLYLNKINYEQPSSNTHQEMNINMLLEPSDLHRQQKTQLDDELELISSDDDDATPPEQVPNDTFIFPMEQIQTYDLTNLTEQNDSLNIFNGNDPSYLIGENHSTNLIREYKQTNPLSEEERKKIHNRSCTLRQRRKYYKHVIIRRNIDRRFTIKQMKRILNQHNIPFRAVNTSVSSITGKMSLFIGLNNSSQLQLYERRTHGLFDSQHYHELQRNKRKSNISYRKQYERNY